MSAPADTLPGIMRVEMSDMDPGSLEDMVGTDCYQAALAYVQREAVLEQIWTAARNELWGLVQGSYGEFYTPLVCFSRQGQVLEVRDIQCSCHVSGGCEHATALLISAVEGAGASTPGRLAGSRPGSRPPAWDSSLESLLASRQEAGRPGQTGPGEPASSWCTDPSSARSSGTATRNSAWMSPGTRPGAG